MRQDRNPHGRIPTHGSFHNQYISPPPIFPWKILWRNDSTQSTPQPEKKGWGLGTKILLLLIVIVVVVSLLAVLTLSVAVLNQPTGSSFPYTPTYRVSLPDGESVTIGNSKILILTMGNESGYIS